MRSTLCVALALLTSTAVAYAQVGTPGMDPEDAVAPTSVVRGPGVKVGEGTVLHPVVGLETGVISNVFYEESDTRASGLLRLLIELGVGSLSTQRLAPIDERDTTSRDPNSGRTNAGEFRYGLDARLSWDQYLSGNDNVSEQGGLGGGLLFRGVVNPDRPWSFGVQDDLVREIRATNFESRSQTNRIVNDLRLNLQWAPAGRVLSGLVHYENKVDVFESDEQEFSNRIQHTAGVRVNWRWLPKTRVYADTSIGYWTGLGDSAKVTSYPLTSLIGIQTAITVNTTVAARVGYTNGFYESGPSYSSVVFGAEAGWRYSPLGRATLGYNYLHNDSINANFYRDHHIRVNIEQRLVPLVLVVTPELMLRHYEGIDMALFGGPPTRDDLILQVTAGMHYNFRNWIAATLNYRFSSIVTDYRYTVDGVTDDPGFVRHDLLLGVRAAL